MDHFRDPRNLGSLPRDAADVGTGEAGRPEEGALIRMQVRVGPDGAAGTVTEVRFKAFGCPATIASGSWAAEWIEGRPVEEACALRSETIACGLDLPEERRGCAELAERALLAALEDLRAKRGRPG